MRTLRVVEASEERELLRPERLHSDREPVDPLLAERAGHRLVERGRVALHRDLEVTVAIESRTHRGEHAPELPGVPEARGAAAEEHAPDPGAGARRVSSCPARAASSRSTASA